MATEAERMTTEAEIGAMWPQVQKCQWPPEARRGKETESAPEPLKASMMLLTP